MRALGPGGPSLSPNARRPLVAALLAAVAAISAAGPAIAQQSSESAWTQFQGGPGRPGSLETGPTPPFRERWRLVAPYGGSLSGAVILDGLAMTVGRRAVYGVDLADGSLAWEVPRAGGPLSVPALALGAGDAPDALLYLEGPEGTQASPSPSPAPTPTDAGQGPRVSELVAIDLADRTELWRVPLGDESRTGVTVDGDVAYVGDDGGTVTAVSIADGEVLWSRGFEADGGCSAATGVVDAPVAAAGDLVVAVARDPDEGTVVVSGFEASDGACRWRLGSQIGSTAVSAPAADDASAIVGFADRSVRALDGEDGEDLWSELVVSIFLPVSAPAFDSGRVVVTDVGGGVYRLDPDTGARIWGYQLNERVLRSSPVISGDAVLAGLADGRLIAIDIDSGHLVWESAATPGLVGTIALSDDVAVAVKGGRDAGLIAFEHDPDGVLVDVPSPAELDLVTTLGRLAIASVITLAITLIPGMLARRRFGKAFPEGDDIGELEPVEEDA